MDFNPNFHVSTLQRSNINAGEFFKKTLQRQLVDEGSFENK